MKMGGLMRPAMTPAELQENVVTITMFLRSLKPRDRSEFMNTFVAPPVGEAIGKHYRMMVEYESAQIEAALQTRRALAFSEQAAEAVPQIMKEILVSLEELERTYGQATFDKQGPFQPIWDVVLVTSTMTLINVAFSAYQGMAPTFAESLDLIKGLIEAYKRRFQALQQP